MVGEGVRADTHLGGEGGRVNSSSEVEGEDDDDDDAQESEYTGSGVASCGINRLSGEV